jgi:AcrR family transcriptional regulator
MFIPYTPGVTMQTAKRDAILEAALDLFAYRGFHGTAVPLVAEKAGVGAGTLYRYFESKEALVNALYQKLKLELGQALLADFPSDKPHRERFRDMWRRLFAYAHRNRAAVKFLELHHHGSYLDTRSRQVHLVLVDSLSKLVVEAQERKILRPMKPALLISLVYGAFVGLVKGSWDGFFAITPEIIDEGERAIWDAIRA